jgi:hypothetical protein
MALCARVHSCCEEPLKESAGFSDLGTRREALLTFIERTATVALKAVGSREGLSGRVSRPGRPAHGLALQAPPRQCGRPGLSL